MKFSGLEINGLCFKETIDFDFFDKQTQIGSIVYGKNGSGKSSISKAFSEKSRIVSGEVIEKPGFSIINFKGFSNESGIETNIQSDETIKIVPIFVFDEEFILNNVHFKDEGLETIVMLGEQQGVYHEISKVKLEIDKVAGQLKELEESKSKYDGSSSTDSPALFLGKIKQDLRVNWAEKQRIILGNKVNSSVNNDLVFQFFDSEESDIDLTVLQKLMDSKLTDYSKYKMLSTLPIPKLLTMINNIIVLKELLLKEISKPDLNDREAKILNILKSSNNKYLSDTRTIMNEEMRDSCPVCFQSLDSEYKVDILNAIEEILLTESAQEHKEELEKINLTEIDFNAEVYVILGEPLIFQSIDNAITDYNDEIKRLKGLLLRKKENAYIPISLETPINELFNSINLQIQRLIASVNNFNSNIEKKEILFEELKSLNKQIAIKRNKEMFCIYEVKKKEEKDVIDEIDSKISMKNILERKLKDLEIQMANTGIACDVINEYLSFIFYDKNRLTLHSNSDFYTIKCRGERIKVSSLSIGERNAVALCYFFSLLYQGKIEEDTFLDPYLIILDDPVSSFDFENKVGIYSFLRYLLSKIHSGNEMSKVIFFTHDLEAFYNVEKIYSDLGFKNRREKDFSTKKLEMGSIEPMDKRTFNEYSQFVQQIYEYASGTNHEVLSSSIGNIMRKVLEAFATFNYKMGIEQLTSSETVLALLPDEKQRIHFGNSMYRLVLHGESHLEERTKGLLDKNFYEYITADEKVRTAKDILIYISILNPYHLEQHLRKKGESQESNNSKLEQIKKWQEELF